MGVFATFCQVCALPVQQNCYVPWKGMYFIYRGPSGHKSPDDPSPAFPFGPEHEWLIRAVALRMYGDEEPRASKGEVQDGFLHADGSDPQQYGFDVEEGRGEYAALHERCWALAGEPDWEPISGIHESEGWTELTPFHEQLFDFDALTEKGLAWTTVDPSLDTEDGRRSRARILGLLGKGT